MSAEETSAEIMSDEQNVGQRKRRGQNVGEKMSADKMSGVTRFFLTKVFLKFFFQNLQFQREILKLRFSNVK